MKVYLVVVAGQNYANAVFAAAVHAQEYADIMNQTRPDARGKWIVTEATPADFTPGNVQLTCTNSLAADLIVRNPGIEFGEDKGGGFFAIDHEAKRAGYAYPYSQNATQAKRNPALVAARMLNNARLDIPTAIAEHHYAHVCKIARA